MSLKPKHQRLLLAGLAIAAVLAAVLLAMWGLKDRAAYFYTPADIAAGKAEAGQAMRLGGMVVDGSLQEAPDGVTIRFTVGDGTAIQPVIYRGIVPDLFREGSGVVAEGRMQGNLFVADTILAKHDERYMPPQMEGMDMRVSTSLDTNGNGEAYPTRSSRAKSRDAQPK